MNYELNNSLVKKNDSEVILLVVKILILISINIRIMKAKLSLLLLLSIHYCIAQQIWRPMNTDDFNKPAYGRVSTTGRNPLIVKNDHVFFFNLESSDNNSNGVTRLAIARYAENKWEHINFPLLFTTTTPIDCAVSNNETIYFATNDIWGDGLPVVKKFENGNWTNVGSGISATATSLINIEIGTDNKPWVLYQEANLIKLKKFNGTNWILISETSELMPYATMSLQLDNNDVPYVIFNYYLDGFVRKFNGTSWEEVGITSFANTVNKIAFDTANIPYIAVGNEVKKYTGSAWENIFIPPPPSRGGIDKIENICFNSSNDLYVGYTKTIGPLESPGFLIKKLTNGSWQNILYTYDSNDKIFTAFGDNAYQVSYGNYGYFPSILKHNGTQSIKIGGTPIYTTYNNSNYTDPNETSAELFTHDFSVCNGTPLMARLAGNKASAMMYVNDMWNNLGPIVISENEINKAAIKSGTDGKIYMAYNNRLSASLTNTRLTVKQLTISGWEAIGPVNFSLTAGSYFDFKVSHANEPYVLYMSGRLQKFNGTNWVFVGGSAYTGNVATRLAFDVNDVPYIAYLDESNNFRITVKRLNGNVWEYVDQSGLQEYAGRSYRPRIVIDNANNVYIGFEDLSFNLHIKKLVNGIWQSVGPDFFTTQKTNQFEMAVDHNNVLYLTYNELENEFRSYAKVKKFNGTDWELVGSSQVSSESVLQSKIDFSPNNTPIICYSTVQLSVAGIYTKFFGQEDALGIEEYPVTPNTKWNISPNPTRNTFSINGVSDVNQVEVFDYVGKRVFLEKAKTKDIDISFLHNGIYIVKITTDNGTSSLKLVKN